MRTSRPSCPGVPVSAVLAVMLLLATAQSAAAAEELAFGDMYIRKVLGFSFSAKSRGLAGKQVSVTGFMAPPLRAQGRFFVLTREPVSLCPFCNTDPDWPMDILVIYLKAEETFVQRNRPLVVTGRLEIGSYTDPDTGFVSQARLVDATYRDR